ncbi:MAG: hypothetical protein KAU14_08730 [Thermoplasmata archaeon]|nr:hypothetical protein [Thermoplasmata archaeon]
MERIDDEIRERFKQASHDGRITCAQALDLAKELGIPTKSVAHMLTEMDLKIINCQLGCFP